jgi:HrpA-like RNA helicase
MLYGLRKDTHRNKVAFEQVHERSVENDLVLSCVLELMLSEREIRLVLMSATADLRRYTEYFTKLSNKGHRGEGDIKVNVL